MLGTVDVGGGEGNAVVVGKPYRPHGGGGKSNRDVLTYPQGLDGILEFAS